METKKWYVGQKVWDKTESSEEGEVIEVRKDSIIVCFINTPNNNYVEYNFKGGKVLRNNMFSDFITLSTKPYEIKMEGFSQEVEEELPYKGQVCWGKTSTTERWLIGHFMERSESEYVLSYGGISADFLCQEITTKNPYEDVSEMENTDREPKIGDMVFAWDDENPTVVICGKLNRIVDSYNKYEVEDDGLFKHCSLKNPLVK